MFQQLKKVILIILCCWLLENDVVVDALHQRRAKDILDSWKISQAH